MLLNGYISNDDEERANILYNHPDNEKVGKNIKAASVFLGEIGKAIEKYTEYSDDERFLYNDIGLTNVDINENNKKTNLFQNFEVENQENIGLHRNRLSKNMFSKSSSKNLDKINIYSNNNNDKYMNSDTNDVSDIDMFKNKQRNDVISDNLNYKNLLYNGNPEKLLDEYSYEEIKNMAQTPDDRKFFYALDYVYQNEGGYSNHKDDKGGKTNFGIAQATYDDYCRRHNLPYKSVQYLNKQETIQIYYNDYWKKSGADKASNIIESIILFDTAVLHGIYALRKFLKEAKGNIYKIPEIRKKYYNYKVDEYNKNIAENKKQNNKDPNSFYNGWMNRVLRLEQFIENLEI